MPNQRVTIALSLIALPLLLAPLAWSSLSPMVPGGHIATNGRLSRDNCVWARPLSIDLGEDRVTVPADLFSHKVPCIRRGKHLISFLARSNVLTISARDGQVWHVELTAVTDARTTYASAPCRGYFVSSVRKL